MESQATRADHLSKLLSREYDWSTRQRQVLNLLTSGRSNQEIADELGVSLDGAKWHVREIFAKLGVDSRDEAAEYWRARNGLRLRFSRLVRSLVPGTAWAKAVLGTAALAGFGLATALVVVALQTGNTAPAADNDSAAPASATATAPPSASVQATPVTVTGLFEDPRPTNARQVELPPAPPSAFQTWDGVSTVIYDTQTLKKTNLGPGSLPSFSPDGTRAVWVALEAGTNGGDGEVRVIDLRTGAVTSFGRGNSSHPVFMDENTIAFLNPGVDFAGTAIDLRTGVRTPISEKDITNNQYERYIATTASTPDGYRIPPEGDSATPPPYRFQVLDPNGAVALEVDAMKAVPAGTGHIAVETAPNSGKANIFLIDIRTGMATFVATTPVSTLNSLLLADEGHVIWYQEYCAATVSPTVIYSRSTGTAISVGLGSAMALTPDGQLRYGGFGGTALIDPATLSVTSVIPNGGVVVWSGDYRYAAHGFAGGHGGACG